MRRVRVGEGYGTLSFVSSVDCPREKETADPIANAEAARPLILQCRAVANLNSKARSVQLSQVLFLLASLNQFLFYDWPLSLLFLPFLDETCHSLALARFVHWTHLASSCNPLSSAVCMEPVLAIEHKFAMLLVHCFVACRVRYHHSQFSRVGLLQDADSNESFVHCNKRTLETLYTCRNFPHRF